MSPVRRSAHLNRVPRAFGPTPPFAPGTFEALSEFRTFPFATPLTPTRAEISAAQPPVFISITNQSLKRPAAISSSPVHAATGYVQKTKPMPYSQREKIPSTP